MAIFIGRGFKNRVNESMPKFQKRFENELGMQTGFP